MQDFISTWESNNWNDVREAEMMKTSGNPHKTGKTFLPRSVFVRLHNNAANL